jgi:hypothetical protein
MSTNHSSWRVAPLEHMVHPEGYVTQNKHKQRKRMRRVVPLEHVVCPEGNVVLMLMKETNLNRPKIITP